MMRFSPVILRWNGKEIEGMLAALVFLVYIVILKREDLRAGSFKWGRPGSKVDRHV